MEAVGEAAKRQQQEVVDCRKWGRYLGRIHRGENKKTMVVVQVYFPDAQYNSTSNAESYSQLLEAKAAVVTQGTPAGRWRLGMAPPKPDSAQLQHPRRLLAETELAKIAKRATTVFMCKPGLSDCGANIVASVIVPTVVYPLAFAKARKKAVETIESGYGNVLRRSMGVAQGFPWEVLSGSPEFDGLGALRLTTEVTKARLRQFQSLISSTYDSETSLAMGMLQIWHNSGVGSVIR